MDLSTLNTNAASDIAKKMKLRNPFTNELIKDESESPIEFEVLGMQSQAGKNAIADQMRKSRADMTDEELDRNGAELLARLVVSWSDNIHLGKEKLSYSYENAVRLFMSEDWIAKQVLNFSTKLRNYDPNA